MSLRGQHIKSRPSRDTALRWGQVMASFDYDYFVIGAGSGGVRSSRIAATHLGTAGKVAVAGERTLLCTRSEAACDDRCVRGAGRGACVATRVWHAARPGRYRHLLRDGPARVQSMPRWEARASMLAVCPRS